jgi:3-hydroxybutyryl-CoA dehydrogenase
MARISTTQDMSRVADSEFIIEAVVENEAVKVKIFQELNKLAKPNVIIATNTSSVSITRMGTASGRPASFVGMHFMNPPPVMKLLEVVVGLTTSPETVDFVEKLADRLGKTHVRACDYPGFIVNRILLPMINEAVCALQDAVGSPQDIDTAMMQGTNQPMGPLALADLIGLDTVLAIMEVMHHTFGDSKYRPAPLLRRYVDAGYLGRKNGRGFFVYKEG